MDREQGFGTVGSRRLVIGGVGHRSLSGDSAALERAIEEAFATFEREYDRTPGETRLLISVAEGADRLIIQAAHRAGIAYQCVLPCSTECFAQDFEREESVQEYHRLLADANRVIHPDVDPIEKLDGYQWATEYIVDHADVILAVWDGGPSHGPGGTANAVELASERGIPVHWIPSAPPHELQTLPLHVHGGR
jgi:hypothetical protein